jgi:hypothetical protein
MHTFFCFGSSTLSVPQKLPLAYARQLHESRFQKQVLFAPFQHFGDTFSVYISSRLVEKCKIKAQCAACYAKRISKFVAFDDTGGFLLGLCDSMSFQSLSAKSLLIHLSPGDSLFQAQH